jgi:type I restriction enzyme, S subunit
MVVNSWKKCLFKTIAQIDMGQSPSGDTYNDHGVGTPLINGPTEFRARHPVKIQWTSKPTKICKIGDVLICVRGSSTGRINIADDNYCIGRGIAAIRYINQEGSTSYLEYLLRFYSQQILARTGGSTFPNLDKQSLENMEILSAPINEQQKIAEILGTWDEAIDLLEKLITAKSKLKQGLMQQLLTGKKRLN